MKKKILGPKFGPKSPKSVSKLGFLPFSQVWFLIFPSIAYNDSLQQWLTCSGKIHEKKCCGPKFWPKTRFFAIFSSLVY